MKLLVTGGAGFIGSAVVRLAIDRGFEVVNVDSLTYAACLDNLASEADQPAYAFEHVDIRDRVALDGVFARHRPDRIMHLAAESHVDRSIDGPADFIETNVLGTFQLLEAARAYWSSAGKPDGFRFHHISTDEVFGSLPADPSVQFTESTPYDPRSPYSASKAASDHLVRAWYETYGLPVVLTNCSNNYGPYHFPEKLIPLVILKALAETPFLCTGRARTSETGSTWRTMRMRCYSSSRKGGLERATTSAERMSAGISTSFEGFARSLMRKSRKCQALMLTRLPS